MSTILKSIMPLLAAAPLGVMIAPAHGSDEIVSLQGKITLEQASTIATEQLAGTIIGAELESEDGIAVWEIEILNSEGVVYEVELNATTGEVLEVEEDD